MKQLPLVSVILPVYNGEKYLRESIDSILSQTYKNFELIIIDDCSTDNSANIIKGYDDCRIKYIRNHDNLKIAKTLNKGIEVAKGKYIARMDADDIALPTRFEKQVEILEKQSDIDIVNIRFNIMTEEGIVVKQYNSNIIPSTMALSYLIYIDSFICHPGVMIRTNIYKKYQYATEDQYYNVEDCELWIRMMSNGVSCHTIFEPLLNYRVNTSSVTHTTKGKLIQKKNVCDLYQNALLKNLNLNIKKTTISLIKGNVDNLMFRDVENFVNDINKYFEYIKTIEIKKEIVEEIYSWAVFCKFKIMILILKSNISINLKLKSLFLLFKDLYDKIFTIFKTYIKVRS